MTATACQLTACLHHQAYYRAQLHLDALSVAHGLVTPNSIAYGLVNPNSVAHDLVNPDSVAHGIVNPSSVTCGLFNPNNVAHSAVTACSTLSFPCVPPRPSISFLTTFLQFCLCFPELTFDDMIVQAE